MKTITVEGSTTTEAINKGLKELNCSREDVNVRVLDNGVKKSFYSILDARVVQVELTLTDEYFLKEKAKNRKNRDKYIKEDDVKDVIEYMEVLLKEFCEALPFEGVDYEITFQKEHINIELVGENSANLIGEKGKVLTSLQKIWSAIIFNHFHRYVPLYVNCDGYRENREEKLIDFAHKMENKVYRTKRKVELKPMNAFDRKVIHNALQDSTKVYTYSIGSEPRRKLVIELR